MASRRLGSNSGSAENLVLRLIRRWREGAPPGARSALDRHPELTENPTLALDLAYEEFCLRRERGETIRASAFCDQFPALRSSLQRMLVVHDLLDAQFDAARHEPPVIWPKGGESFVGFHLVEELGRGGLARVYLAVQPDVGCRPVVLKISPHETGEAEILGRLSHEHIVPVYSRHSDPATGMSVVCMPYLGRKTLCDVLDGVTARKRRPQAASAILKQVRSNRTIDADVAYQLPVAAHQGEPLSGGMPYLDAVARIGFQLAEALAYTHDQGILHLDLKPSNILITPRGIPMLLDFNLACDVHSRRVLVGGTVPYMAPEALDALLAPPHAPTPPPDGRADLYSLGVILYQLATGTLLDDTLTDRLTSGPGVAQRGESRARPSRLPRLPPDPRLDLGFWSILRRCLAPCPDHRFASAHELATALRMFVDRRQRSPAVRPTPLRWLPYILLVSLALGALASRLIPSKPTAPPSTTHEPAPQSRITTDR